MYYVQYETHLEIGIDQTIKVNTNFFTVYQ